MTQALDQSIIELLHASRDDQETMQLAVNDRTFGFHAQQAVEKLLKAIIGGHGERYAFTHDIGTLLSHASTLGEQIAVPINSIVYLTAYAGVWRYQDPIPIPESQREELRSIISALRSFTLGRLGQLRPNIDWFAV